MINNHLLTVLVPMPPEELGVALPHKYMLMDTSILFNESEDMDLKTRSLEPVCLFNIFLYFTFTSFVHERKGDDL